MNFHGTSAVQQAQRLAMIADKDNRANERSTGGQSNREAEPPTLAGYIVYVVSVAGFVIMCLLAAFR